MKQYRKFERLIGDMRRLIEAGVPEVEDLSLTGCSFEIGGFRKELACDPVKVGMLLEVVVRLRESDVRERQGVEERILRFVTYLALLCQREPGNRVGSEDLIQSELAGESVPNEGATIPGMLHEFALGCLAFRRSRDAFGGKRRAAAFEILAEVGLAWESAEVEAMAIKAIMGGRSAEARAALDFMTARVVATKVEPDESLVNRVQRMIERGDSEAIVFAGLNALVEWSVISELEAMDRMDDWRAKHYGR